MHGIIRTSLGVALLVLGSGGADAKQACLNKVGKSVACSNTKSRTVEKAYGRIAPVPVPDDRSEFTRYHNQMPNMGH
jgi:hypothetical protein